MADRHVIIKNAVKEIANAQGKAVTFMAKWRYNLAEVVESTLSIRRFGMPRGDGRCSPTRRLSTACRR